MFLQNYLCFWRLLRACCLRKIRTRNPKMALLKGITFTFWICLEVEGIDDICVFYNLTSFMLFLHIIFPPFLSICLKNFWACERIYGIDLVFTLIWILFQSLPKVFRAILSNLLWLNTLTLNKAFVLFFSPPPDCHLLFAYCIRILVFLLMRLTSVWILNIWVCHVLPGNSYF